MRLRCALLILTLPTLALAQRFEDPPIVVEKKPLSIEQAKEKERLVREAQVLYGLGVYRERGDRVLEALRLFEEALKLEPDSVVIRRSLIPIYVVLGREVEALEGCKKILELDPEDFEVAFKYAGLLRVHRPRSEAIDALRLALKSKRIGQRVDKQLLIRLELCSDLNRAGDFPAEATTLQELVDLIETRKGELLLTGAFTESELANFRIEGYEKLARAAMKNKDFNLARKAFQSARQLLLERGDEVSQDSATRIDWHLCEIATAQERYQDALRYVDSYLRTGRVSLEPYERKIFLLRKLNRPREVIEAARKMAANEPHHVGLQLLLARELSTEPNFRLEAEKLYRDLADRYTRPDIYRGMFKLFRTSDQMARVLAMIDETLGLARDKEATAETREAASDRYRAMLAALSDEPELVRSLIDAAATELRNFQFGRKNNLETWTFLARLAASTKQLDHAENFYRQCLRNASPPQKIDIYFGLMDILRRSHKWKELVATASEVVERPARDKSPVEAYFRLYLGIGQAELGRLDEAIRQFDIAYALPSSDQWKQELREAKVRALSHAGKDKEAIAECEKLLRELKLPAEQRQVRLTLATVYGLAGQHAEADRQLEMLLETDPNDALVNNNLGYQWAERNVRLPEAEKLIRRALELDRLQRDGEEDGDKAAYLDSLGWVLFRKGELAEARRVLERASSLPDGASDGTVWDHLGDVYFKLKEPQKARQAWESALKLFESDSRARREGRVEDGRRKLQMLR